MCAHVCVYYVARWAVTEMTWQSRDLDVDSDLFADSQSAEERQMLFVAAGALSCVMNKAENWKICFEYYTLLAIFVANIWLIRIITYLYTFHCFTSSKERSQLT